MVSEVEILVTPIEARDMRDAIRLLEQTEAQQARTQNRAEMATALAWFNTLGINIQSATTRTQAQSNFNQIEALSQTETDRHRLAVLRIKLGEANEKCSAVKKVNPNS